MNNKKRAVKDENRTKEDYYQWKIIDELSKNFDEKTKIKINRFNDYQFFYLYDWWFKYYQKDLENNFTSELFDSSFMAFKKMLEENNPEMINLFLDYAFKYNDFNSGDVVSSHEKLFEMIGFQNYLLMLAYQKNKNDYNAFEETLKDCDELITFQDTNPKFFTRERLELLNNILGVYGYVESQKFRNIFKEDMKKPYEYINVQELLDSILEHNKKYSLMMIIKKKNFSKERLELINYRPTNNDQIKYEYYTALASLNMDVIDLINEVFFGKYNDFFDLLLRKDLSLYTNVNYPILNRINHLVLITNNKEIENTLKEFLNYKDYISYMYNDEPHEHAYYLFAKNETEVDKILEYLQEKLNHMKKIDACYKTLEEKGVSNIMTPKELYNISHDFFDTRYEVSPILLLNNRYQYLKDKCIKHDCCYKTKYKIIEMISKCNYDFFEQSSILLNEDVFRICIDECFNSNTYKELFNKLEFISNYSNDKGLWDKDNCNDIDNSIQKFLNDLKTKNFMEEINGEQPKKIKITSHKIIDRMEKVYRKSLKIGFSLKKESFPSFQTLLNKSESLDDFNCLINEVVKEKTKVKK